MIWIPFSCCFPERFLPFFVGLRMSFLREVAIAQLWDSLWRDTSRTWQTSKWGHTQPLLSCLSLQQTSPGIYLQVQVVGCHGNSLEWGLFALFLLSSLKLCHYQYSTGTRVYLPSPASPDCQSIYVSACLSSPPPLSLSHSLCWSLPAFLLKHHPLLWLVNLQYSSIKDLFTASASFPAPQLGYSMYLQSLCSASNVQMSTRQRQWRKDSAIK